MSVWTRSRRKFVGIVVLMLVICASARAQAPTGEDRLRSLEVAVHDLSRQVSELAGLVKASLPPSPIEAIPPIDLMISDAPQAGSSSATVVIIEFSDFQCPYCGQNFRTVYPLIRRDFVDVGRVSYVFRHLALNDIHPSAFKAAEASECARDQGKFWEMHDQLFSHQSALGAPDLITYAEALRLDLREFRPCLVDDKKAPRIKKDMDEAKALGLTGTPTFLIGRRTRDGEARVDKRVAGSFPVEILRSALEGALAAVP